MTVAVKLGFFDKLNMFNFVKANASNARALARAYKKEPEKWEALKSEYPDWETYIKDPSFLRVKQELKALGVPL